MSKTIFYMGKNIERKIITFEAMGLRPPDMLRELWNMLQERLDRQPALLMLADMNPEGYINAEEDIYTGAAPGAVPTVARPPAIERLGYRRKTC